MRNLWSAVMVRRRKHRTLRLPCQIIMTPQCGDQIADELRTSMLRHDEGIVYFVGLTTGTTTLALCATGPDTIATPTSVDVDATAIGNIIRAAATAGLQVVGQLHTHPRDAYHSAGDLVGMRIRHPGYFSIVVPEYGGRLPSFDAAHSLMWTNEGFRQVDQPISFFDERLR